MKKFIFGAMTFLFLIGVFSNANALLFDPSGTGTSVGAIDIIKWDWLPSSAVAVNGNGIAEGDTFWLYTFGKLGRAFGPGEVDVTGSLPAGSEITFVAGFQEKVISLSTTPGVTSTAAFTALPGGFFEVYLDYTPDADLDLAGGTAGTGFNGIPSELLFSGSLTGGGGSFTSFFFPLLTNDPYPYPLDQFGDDERPGEFSVFGTGGTSIFANVLFNNFNALYFPGVSGDIIYSYATDTQNNLPFKQVDPANRYWNGSVHYIPSIGLVNGAPGYGPDVIFGMDASTSERQTVIPEPGTLLLLSAGLLGLSSVLRKKMNR